MWYSAVGCIITLTLSLLVAPRAAEAQPRGTVPRIGYIGDTPGPYVDAFRQGLRERGYIEGETIAIEYRWQEGRHERLPDLVAELVQLRVDVLVPVGTQPSRAAKQATSTIPIVMAQVGDPVGSGLVTSLAKPGGNMTGVSVIGPDIGVNQLELLKQAVPGASRVAVLWNPTNPAAGAVWRELQRAAPGLGVILRAVAVQEPEEFRERLCGHPRGAGRRAPRATGSSPLLASHPDCGLCGPDATARNLHVPGMGRRRGPSSLWGEPTGSASPGGGTRGQDSQRGQASRPACRAGHAAPSRHQP